MLQNQFEVHRSVLFFHTEFRTNKKQNKTCIVFDFCFTMSFGSKVKTCKSRAAEKKNIVYVNMFLSLFINAHGVLEPKKKKK